MKKLAVVIEYNDEEKRGRVLVRILPEMSETPASLLPWAVPLNIDFSGTSKETGYTHQVPEISSFIYCDVSDDWTLFEYTKDIPYLGTKYSYDENLKIITDSVEDLEEQVYPQPSYRKTKDGSINFLNTETGEQGLVLPSGFYSHIRANGTVKIKSLETSIEILENGSIKYESSNISFNFDNEAKEFVLTGVDRVKIGSAGDVAVLFEPLKEILSKLLSHNHVAPSGPTTPAQEASGTPLSSLSPKLNNMKSIIHTD